MNEHGFPPISLRSLATKHKNSKWSSRIYAKSSWPRLPFTMTFSWYGKDSEIPLFQHFGEGTTPEVSHFSDVPQEDAWCFTHKSDDGFIRMVNEIPATYK